MPREIRTIESQDVWQPIVDHFAPHSFLQSWHWGEFHQRTGHTVFRLAVFDQEVCVAAVQAIVIRARRGSFLFCPHGPMLASMVDRTSVLSDVISHLKTIAKKESCVCIRVSSLFSAGSDSADCFRQLGFRDAPTHMHPELAWILDLSPSEEELLSQMRKTSRYSIKKAQKDGVVVTQSQEAKDIDRFWGVYQATVQRQGFTPFSKEYLRTQFEIFHQDDCVRLFFAEYQGQTIATAMIIFDQLSGYYHHGASTHAFPNIPASHLIQWHAICEAKRRGCQLYNFWGVVPEDQIKHPWAGLSLFKRGFGGHEEAYLHAQDYPLRLRYWLTYSIESIRRWRRRL